MAIAPWRLDLMPASFRDAEFHVEMGSMEGGRRIVVHEFPKKDIPYPEDMGRRARMFSVRGYCITYPTDTPDPLYRLDYRTSRDLLITALEYGGPNQPAALQLPTRPPMQVVCMSYRWTEEQRFGGYCTFDMQFVEWGMPGQPQQSASAALTQQANALRNQVLFVLANASDTVNTRQLAGLTSQG